MCLPCSLQTARLIVNVCCGSSSATGLGKHVLRACPQSLGTEYTHAWPELSGCALSHAGWWLVVSCGLHQPVLPGGFRKSLLCCSEQSDFELKLLCRSLLPLFSQQMSYVLRKTGLKCREGEQAGEPYPATKASFLLSCWGRWPCQKARKTVATLRFSQGLLSHHHSQPWWLLTIFAQLLFAFPELSFCSWPPDRVRKTWLVLTPGQRQFEN